MFGGRVSQASKGLTPGTRYVGRGPPAQAQSAAAAVLGPRGRRLGGGARALTRASLLSHPPRPREPDTAGGPGAGGGRSWTAGTVSETGPGTPAPRRPGFGGPQTWRDPQAARGPGGGECGGVLGQAWVLRSQQPGLSHSGHPLLSTPCHPGSHDQKYEPVIGGARNHAPRCWSRFAAGGTPLSGVPGVGVGGAQP